MKSNAIKFIDSEVDLERWKENSKLLEKRKQVLLELKEKLNMPQPPEKKVKRYGKPYKCEWKIGDVFAYPLKSEEAKEVGLDSQYLILIKTGETVWYPEHIIPVVKIKVTKNGKIPATVEEINELEYVQSNVYTYYNGIPVTLTGFKQQKDEYGLTPHYDIGIITTSKRVIPKELQYLGNFSNKIIFPKLEFKKTKASQYDLSSGKYIGWKELEQASIEAYKLYNLKQLELYQPDYWEKRGIDRVAVDKRIEESFKKRGLL